MIGLNRVHLGDCMEVMKGISDASVDLIVTDMPFGVTRNSWDKPLSLKDMWDQVCRIKKENAAMIFFGAGMFTAELMISNKKMWRYNLVWEKGDRATGFLNAHKMPLRSHEDILVFYSTLPTYHPQFTRGQKTHARSNRDRNNHTYGKIIEKRPENFGHRKFPKSVLKFEKPHPPVHPSEKPVDLLEYLILTYSNENDTVLDFCIGSGTTAIAAMRTGRNFIGIEKEPAYVALAEGRLAQSNNCRITDYVIQESETP